MQHCGRHLVGSLLGLPPTRLPGWLARSPSPSFRHALPGFDAFRGRQLDAIKAALRGQDSFVLMPTGQARGGACTCWDAVQAWGHWRGAVRPPLLPGSIPKPIDLRRLRCGKAVVGSLQSCKEARAQPWESVACRCKPASPGSLPVSLAAGGGKSLCYALVPAVRPGVVLVVSPLIALMQDQTQASVTARRLPALPASHACVGVPRMPGAPPPPAHRPCPCPAGAAGPRPAR